MATIGLIGAGKIGSQLARLAVAHGYDVVISNSRGPDTLTALVAELGPKARAATAVDAAKAGDIVVVTIPLKNYPSVPVEPLAGKIVIDTNNYYPQRDGHIAELDNESTTTSELLQAHLPTSKVVKAFNHIYAAQLTTDGRPAGIGHRRQRRCGEIHGHAPARRVRVRCGGCRPAQGGVAHSARHTRLWPATHGGESAQGPGGSQAVRGRVVSRLPGLGLDAGEAEGVGRAEIR
jgi:predicted dinucleotide-binding enzyme